MSLEAVETSDNIDRDVAYVTNFMEDGPRPGIAGNPDLRSVDRQPATASPDPDDMGDHIKLHLNAPGNSDLNRCFRNHNHINNCYISSPNVLINNPEGASSNILNDTEVLQNITQKNTSKETVIHQETNKLNNEHLDAISKLDNDSLDALAEHQNQNSEQRHSKFESSKESAETTTKSPANELPINYESILNLKPKVVKIDNIDSNLILNLATSTTSLNEQITGTVTASDLSILSHSKSAEDISTASTNSLETDKLNSSTKELNAEKILLDFSNQKPKVTATQKLSEDQKPEIPDTNNPNLDLRYARIPKELLSQDIGNIVKNVHGIFSSVSGSLKNAYNHSHKATIAKPTAKLIKPIPNGKVMNDIFEDEKAEQIQIESEKPNPASSKIDSKMEQNKEVNTNTQMWTDTKTDVLKLQIETLERVLAEQRKENSSLRDRVRQQVDEMQEKDQAFKELETKLDAMSKRVEIAERDKDAAVMRYASVECAAIEAKRAAERSAHAEKSALAETELVSAKLKSAHAEKQRICQLYDDKCHELSNSERELAKVREEVKELEGRLKWNQSKLRMEIDAYKDSAERAEKLSQRVSELEAAKGASAASAADAAKVKQLESELSESQAALILCRHERDGLEKRVPSLSRQLQEAEQARDCYRESAENALKEVSLLRAANSSLEQEAAELAALRAQAALADTLQARLQRESERASQAEELARCERARADTCARRERAALEHGASLTARHVAAAAQAETSMAKAQALEVDNVALRSRALELEGERNRLMASLKEESERRDRENRVLARKVAELTEELNELNKKLEWEKGENDVLKKKHANAIKELNRELHRALKRCDQLGAKLQPPVDNTRTESVSSLSSSESAVEDSRSHNGHVDPVPDIQVREPDRQALIERIVSLQRAAARRAERCDFLEEHSRQLTTELRKKSRLLRSLLCTMPTGAVASEDSDAHKKEIARMGGGAMAAVWGGDPNGMTLELSLEMNTRLQAVLEDALLKNITLKENMDTLGEEISKLKTQKGSMESKKDPN